MTPTKLTNLSAVTIAVLLIFGTAGATAQIIDDTPDTPDIPTNTPEPPDKPTIDETPTIPNTPTKPDKPTIPETPSIGTKSLTGAAFAVPASLEDEIESYRSKIPQNLAPHGFVLATPDQLYIVFTDTKPTSGEASVTGKVLQSKIQADGMTYGAILASEVSFTTDGEKASLSEIVENPQQYETDLVKVTANHRKMASLTDPDSGEDFTAASYIGVLTKSPITASSITHNIGGKVRGFIESASSDKAKTSVSERVEQLTQSDKDRLLTVGFQTKFWTDSQATADGIVLKPGSEARQFIMKYHEPEMLKTTEGLPLLYVVQSSIPDTSYNSVKDVRSNANDGDVVSLTANIVGQKMSTQESLEHSTGCGEDQARIDTPSGSACVNIVQDALVHTGVAFNEPPTSRQDTLFVVGVSSRHFDQPNQRFKGEYQLTGEIVSTKRIDPNLPEGKILVIYDMQRKNDIALNELAQEAQNVLKDQSNELRDTIKQQMLLQLDGKTHTSTVTPEHGIKDNQEVKDSQSEKAEYNSSQQDGRENNRNQIIFVQYLKIIFGSIIYALVLPYAIIASTRRALFRLGY